MSSQTTSARPDMRNVEFAGRHMSAPGAICIPDETLSFVGRERNAILNGLNGSRHCSALNRERPKKRASDQKHGIEKTKNRRFNGRETTVIGYGLENVNAIESVWGPIQFTRQSIVKLRGISACSIDVRIFGRGWRLISQKRHDYFTISVQSVLKWITFGRLSIKNLAGCMCRGTFNIYGSQITDVKATCCRMNGILFDYSSVAQPVTDGSEGAAVVAQPFRPRASL